MATAASLVEVLQRRAVERPDGHLYTYLADGEHEGPSVTLGELDRQASAIAHVLREQGLAGERVLLLYPPGVDFAAGFFGCLYAGAVAVPAYPPDPTRLDRSLPRLQAMLADSQAAGVLTVQMVVDGREVLRGMAPELDALRWIATDQLDSSGARWSAPALGPETVAFLQYTSGSTAAPKGIVLSHGNLLHNLRTLHTQRAIFPGEVGISWLPPYHDMGLIGKTLYPVYAGYGGMTMSPIHFLRRPYSWLAAMSRYRAVSSAAPNFAYDLCVRKIAPDERAKLDLSNWRCAFNGAEPVRPETIERFVAAFGPCGFRREAFFPCYGLAETTLIVSGGVSAAEPSAICRVDAGALETGRVIEAKDDRARALVSSGKPLGEGERVEIVDPESGIPCPADRVGEIWVSGPNVAQGYWNQPEATAQTFGATLHDGSGPFVRTGDMGFLRGGQLFVTGRLKDLIIIRGRNIAPQDVERTVEGAHPALRQGCSAAFSVEVDGQERLVVVNEVDAGRESEGAAVIEAIRDAVAEAHGLPAHAVVLIEARSIPKTSSGKIQRRATRALFLEGSLAIVAAWSETDPATVTINPKYITAAPSESAVVAARPIPDAVAIEEWLRTNVAAVLGLAPQDINVHKPIATYGIDSAEVAGVVGDLEAWLERSVPLDLIWEWATTRELAARLGQHLGDTPSEPSEPPPARA